MIKHIEAELEQIGIIPVIKLEDTSKAVLLARALIDGGINCAEVTFRAEGADKVIRQIAAEFPEMIVGAGTVLTTAQADAAIAAGAKFIVSPGFNPTVVKHVLAAGIPVIPGVSTCGEIEQAMELGLKAVKFFPAEQAGGIAYIKAVSAPYAAMRFVPTGGVNENNLNDYLSFDKVIACGGSWMVSADLIKQEKWAEITALSRSAVNKMLGFELAHVGINSADEAEAENTANGFNALFGFEVKKGSSSIFAGAGIEVMKTKYLGANGHIGVKTNSVLRALYTLEKRGYEADLSTAKYDDKGKMTAIYLKAHLGGFAVHLLQKK